MTKLSFSKLHKNVFTGNDICKQLKNIKTMPKLTLQDINNMIEKVYKNKSEGIAMWTDLPTWICIPKNSSKETYDAVRKLVSMSTRQLVLKLRR